MPDVFTKKKRSEVMSKIRSKGTKIELDMKTALENSRIEFKYQPKMLGKPDFLVPPDMVIFCDSSFWHGRHWETLRLRLHEGYWFNHIRKNRLRDRKVRTELRKQGYTVLRFWDTEIEKNIETCIKKIKGAKK